METLQRTANRGSVSTKYDVDNSVKLDRLNAEKLQFTFDQAATNLKKNTLSIWFKRNVIGVNQGLYQFGDDASGEHTYIRFTSSDDKGFLRGNFGSNVQFLLTTQSFRDTSAWYHLVVAWDTTQSTASDRLKVYLNGSEITAFDTDNRSSVIPLNHDTPNGENGKSVIIGEGVYDISAYIAETNFVDGQALAPTSFGEFDSGSGIWKPKEYTGTYGNNGFYLDFKNSSNLGEDQSGNNHDFTLNNITAADQSTDTCTNNFCTLNPLVNFKYTTNEITEGATEFGDDTGGGVGGAFGTFAVTKGKWYWEVKLTQQNSHYIGVSAVDDGDNVLGSTDPQDENSSFVFNIAVARIEYVNSGTKSYGSADAFTDFHSAGDIIGIALNMDDNQISIYGNGTLQSGVANSSIYDAANKMVVPFHGTINDECQYNFGGYSAWTPASAASDANGYGTFEYAPPSGYYALCTKNLAEYG
tara:strand:- start:1085 stop:2494 length:1410 start_codon:yes stop_codon:yes gene_type:complete